MLKKSHEDSQQNVSWIQDRSEMFEKKKSAEDTAITLKYPKKYKQSRKCPFT